MIRRLRRLVLGSIVLLSACGEATAPKDDPVATEPAFAGSASCRACHTAEYEAWRGSHHDLAMQHVSESAVLGDFDDASFDYFGQSVRFFRRDGAFVVRTIDDSAEEQDFEVAYVFGVEPLQQYLVEFPGGRYQVLPFTWDSRANDAGGQRWYHIYGDEFIAADDPLFWTRREQNWNYMCAECHSTNLRMNYELSADTFATTWSEINVACEACHGPGSRHNAQAEAAEFGNDYGLVVDLDDHGRSVWQMNPATGIAALTEIPLRPPQQPEACGRCHARRGLLVSDYEYGKPLADTHMVSLLNEPLYFADGQIREEVYVYGSFLQSRMYQAGVTCGDCHDPHSARLKTGDNPNDVCSQCHLPQKFAVTEHHRHVAGTVACVDCHMSSRVYMGVDARRDHSFRVPRPDRSIGTDIPNACNVCHADRGSEWSAQHFADWWAEPRPRAPSGIERATALSELVAPLQPAHIEAVLDALGNADPLVRIAALRASRNIRPEQHLPYSAALLDDAIRGVRVEAALSLARYRDYLPPALGGAFSKAAKEYRAAQLVAGSRPESHFNLGNFAVVTGHRDEALEHYRRAFETAPEISHFAYVYGVALYSTGRHEHAVDVLRAARRQFPDDYDIGWALATILRDTGDAGGARAVAEELQRVFPGDDGLAALLDSLAENPGSVDGFGTGIPNRD